MNVANFFYGLAMSYNLHDKCNNQQEFYNVLEGLNTSDKR